MVRLQRFLVPVDYSPCSGVALRYAMFLAEKVGAEVELLHVVWEPPPYVGMEMLSATLPTRDVGTMAEYTRQMAEREMRRFVAECGLPGADALPRRYAEGSPTHAIVETAGQGYDLIVMGTHGRAGVSHALLGSVAERVVRKAPCPVLTVRRDNAVPNRS